MKILVVGAGFVGLTTALGFADKGHRVFAYDTNLLHSQKISKGEIPFFEKGLPEALERNLGTNFTILQNIDEKQNVDIVFFCVGTPCNEEGKADLQYLRSAIEKVIVKINEDCLLVIKSTIPPGTTEREVIPFIRALGYKNEVVMNPEFLREGYCWKDFTEPDRIVCGMDTNNEDIKEIMSKLYAPFKAPIHFVTFSTAEFIKYLSNSLLAALISFSNEMAIIAENTGNISVGWAFKILHEDNRLKDAGISHYIYPGCGYGGYCLPKDTVALIQNAKDNGFMPSILQEVVLLNKNMPKITAEKIAKRAKKKTDRIGILGLSFKPNSDDVRDSSAGKIINELILQGYSNIYAYDPVANKKFEEAYAFPIYYCLSKEEVCKNCSIVAIVTVWNEFKEINEQYSDIEWIDCRYFL